MTPVAAARTWHEPVKSGRRSHSSSGSLMGGVGQAVPASPASPIGSHPLPGHTSEAASFSVIYIREETTGRRMSSSMISTFSTGPAWLKTILSFKRSSSELILHIVFAYILWFRYDGCMHRGSFARGGKHSSDYLVESYPVISRRI